MFLLKQKEQIMFPWRAVTSKAKAETLSKYSSPSVPLTICRRTCQPCESCRGENVVNQLVLMITTHTALSFASVCSVLWSKSFALLNSVKFLWTLSVLFILCVWFNLPLKKCLVKAFRGLWTKRMIKISCQHMKDQDTIVDKFYTELGHELTSLA